MIYGPTPSFSAKDGYSTSKLSVIVIQEKATAKRLSWT
jgi:hypothetical protein